MIAKQKPRASMDEQTRKQHKQSKKTSFSLRKKENDGDESTRKGKRKIRKRRPVRRIFPIWARLIVFILLCGGALIIGLMIGYGVLGDGAPTDILKKDAWQHIIDIVKKEQ
ncbi:MAG TPA: DNA-directed RNA polymerase subunit beta [Bacillota bacterium]|nr:DNA-directed RNA polymerase subunit beta [Bacillota bacterium]